MKKFITLDVLVAAVLILFLSILVRGPELLMPMNLNSMALILFIISFMVFVGLIFREESSDERETLHKLEAGRVAYLSGIGIITLGIITQSFSYSIDPWLVYALIVMILVKIFARIYFQIKH